jgi:N-acetylglucosaminyldiphosphoundecaprenol N-acetyl-beta-D-mannosaminyltransferase
VKALNRINTVSILGTKISNPSSAEAVALIERLIADDNGTTHPIYIVNAHTLNLAIEHPAFHTVLTEAYCIFGDGTGVRWAARQRGVRMKDNLVGTDLVPDVFTATAGRGYRYYLLGTDSDSIERAARHCEKFYPGWELAGYSHGYLDEEASRKAIATINAARPQLLLVGMGNPKQEQWIHQYRSQLRVPVAIGVGGLFDHWAGNINRAPLWVRKLGYEWLQLLLQQPHKWRRYILGNPRFLYRMTRYAAEEKQ